MRNTIIVSVLLLVAVIAASIFYFTDMGREKKTSTKALTLLPEETLIIVSFKNDETTDNIFRDFEVFDALLGFQQKSNLETLKQQLLRNSSLNSYLLGTDIYLSFHEVNKKIEQLIAIPTIEPIKNNDLTALLSSLNTDYQVSRQDTLGNVIYAMTAGNSDSTFYASYLSDIFFVSYSKSLLLSLSDKSIPKLSQQQIDDFIEGINRNAPLSVFMPHQHIDRIAQQFKRNKPGDFINQFLYVAGQSVWNINYKQDALMLTGESTLTQKEKSYIALFANQSKTTQRLYQYFPANTAMYLEYSLSDVNKFRKDLDRLLDIRQDKKKLENQFQTINKDKPSLVADISTSLGHEFAIIELNNRNYLGFVSIKDSVKLKEIIGDLAESVGDSIYRFRHSNLLYALYGDALKPMQRPYFTIIDDVMVFANYSSGITDYRQRWQKKDLLIGTLGFKNFERLQGNEANVTFFLHTKNASNTLINQLPQAYARNFRNKEAYGYQDFYSWSAQLAGNGGKMISSIYAIYKSTTTLGATPEWTYSFNNRLITRPYVFEHSDTSQFILLQEQDHNVHAIHPSGTKMWTALFSGRIVGDIIQLADRSMIAVTDRNRLYRFDTSGKTLRGFSTGTPAEPTGTPVIVQIQGQQSILVPTKNQLLAYDMEGGRLENWDNVTVEGQLLDGIYQSGEFIVVASTYGRLYFFNQDGTKNKEIDIPSDVEFKSQLGHMKRGDTDIFVVTDTKGNLYQLSYQQEINPFRIETLNDKHRVYFKNLRETDAPEMIAIQDAEFSVYAISDSIQLAYNYSFTRDIESRPLFFPQNGSQYLLGTASRATNLIYLFGDNGVLINGFPVEALPLFYYGKINYNSTNYLLCSRRDMKLYAFKHD